MCTIIVFVVFFAAAVATWFILDIDARIDSRAAELQLSLDDIIGRLNKLENKNV
jgi:hypothetical protein